MRFSAAVYGMAWVAGLLGVGSCRPAARHATAMAHPAITVGPVPLVLALDEGERRVRRFAVSAPRFTIEVDRQNGGSLSQATWPAFHAAPSR